jgi:two-component system, chemotaxis family, protein-glutamate methylesterase/glutaminase
MEKPDSESSGIEMTRIKRDIVVIGASAGGVETLQRLCGLLPADLPATVFIVLHVGSWSWLAEILDRNGPLPAKFPSDGELALPAHIYVAPPERHMELGKASKIVLTRGPRDNGHRPSVDVLFRSAARLYGSRVAGTLLTGALDDGVAGLFAVKARGGATLVQTPQEALVPDVPRQALKFVEVDYSLPLQELASKLVELAREGEEPARPFRMNGEILDRQTDKEGAEFVPVACPECDGPLFETRQGDFSHFACFVGHTYSPQSLSQAHADALERALWKALRGMNERLEMHRRITERGPANESEKGIVRRFGESVEQIEKDIKLLREILERI